MKTKKSKHSPKEIILPSKFIPQFFNTVDGRCSIVKIIKSRYAKLKKDSGVDSYQKDLLAQRAIFIGIQLETMECNAAEGKSIDAGVYTQMVNCLSGLLKALGLQKSKTVLDLNDYKKAKLELA